MKRDCGPLFFHDLMFYCRKVLFFCKSSKDWRRSIHAQVILEDKISFHMRIPFRYSRFNMFHLFLTHKILLWIEYITNEELMCRPFEDQCFKKPSSIVTSPSHCYQILQEYLTIFMLIHQHYGMHMHFLFLISLYMHAESFICLCGYLWEPITFTRISFI